jgi:RNA polymerase sigma factor for flagellar operon FliA
MPSPSSTLCVHTSGSGRANDGESYEADFPARIETQPDSMCARRQLRSTLDRAMETLPERYRKVMLLYYASELTMKEIGDMLGVNESRVSQIHKTALEKMAAALRAEGIHSSRAF